MSTVVCRCKIRDCFGRLSPNALVAILLAAWWVLNLLQAAFTGLANDEAYYWYFSQHLDWGYYDHPPMVALLVWLSSWAPGLLGIRFVSTILQPLYLLLFWHAVRPVDASRRDVVLYLLVCFSQPLLQLYGFMALPDAPLMMFTALFLWSYRRFAQSPHAGNAALMGLSVALLGYSKYHGVLVVALVLMSDLRLFRRWQLYLAGLVALVLLVPHILWQQSHEWASVQYHLVGRNAWEYKPAYTLEYLATAVAIFNPLWIYHYVKGARLKWGGLHRAGLFLTAGFLLFFLVATLRGRVQPQWLLPAALPLTAMLFHAGRQSRYVRVAGAVCAVLFVVVRLLAVVNPLHLQGEIWEGREPYDKVAAIADGRPVQFYGCYSFAAKYAYYTGNPTHCTTYFYYRNNQWQYDTTDRTFAGREVLAADLGEMRGTKVPLTPRRTLRYTVVNDYRPMRELHAELLQPLDLSLPLLPRADTAKPADSLPPFSLTVAVRNPYPYDICSSPESPVLVRLFFHVDERHAPSATGMLTDTLRAGMVTVLEQQFALRSVLPDGEHASGIAIGYTYAAPPCNSRVAKRAVILDGDTLRITETDKTQQTHAERH